MTRGDPEALYFCSISDISLTFHKVKIQIKNSLTNHPVEKFRICAPGMGGANKSAKRAKVVDILEIFWHEREWREEGVDGTAPGVEN